ncbi:MAG: TraR/DksA C4-type zinc finger protein [Paludibaculum sp.]
MLETNVNELSTTARRRESIHIEPIADALDRTLRAAEREIAVLGLEADAARLRAARAALRRMDEGTYGICLNCEQEIGPRRLAAMPAASLCIICQEETDTLDNTAGRRWALPLAA